MINKQIPSKPFGKKPGSRSELTQREKEVAGYIVHEYSYKMIADALGISIRTVGTHVRNIHNKTGKHNAAGVSNHLHSKKRIR